MKIPLNNYCKYISGVFFAISGYVLAFFAIIEYSTPKDPSGYNFSFTLLGSLIISSIILLVGIIEFFIRYLYKHIRRYGEQSSIKMTKAIIIYRILFWLGILFTQIPFPFDVKYPPIVIVFVDVFKTLFSNISYIIQNHF